jgi:hypothetical protein
VRRAGSTSPTASRGDASRRWTSGGKKIYPNVDFFSASVYTTLGIETDLFTPIFAMSRVTGWTAHLLEQYANNRLIRPKAEYIGPRGLKVGREPSAEACHVVPKVVRARRSARRAPSCVCCKRASPNLSPHPIQRADVQRMESHRARGW